MPCPLAPPRRVSNGSNSAISGRAVATCDGEDLARLTSTSTAGIAANVISALFPSYSEHATCPWPAIKDAAVRRPPFASSPSRV